MYEVKLIMIAKRNARMALENVSSRRASTSSLNLGCQWEDSSDHESNELSESAEEDKALVEEVKDKGFDSGQPRATSGFVRVHTDNTLLACQMENTWSYLLIKLGSLILPRPNLFLTIYSSRVDACRMRSKEVLQVEPLQVSSSPLFAMPTVQSAERNKPFVCTSTMVKSKKYSLKKKAEKHRSVRATRGSQDVRDVTAKTSHAPLGKVMGRVASHLADISSSVGLLALRYEMLDLKVDGLLALTQDIVKGDNKDLDLNAVMEAGKSLRLRGKVDKKYVLDAAQAVRTLNALVEDGEEDEETTDEDLEFVVTSSGGVRPMLALQDYNYVDPRESRHNSQKARRQIKRKQTAKTQLKQGSDKEEEEVMSTNGSAASTPKSQAEDSKHKEKKPSTTKLASPEHKTDSEEAGAPPPKPTVLAKPKVVITGPERRPADNVEGNRGPTPKPNEGTSRVRMETSPECYEVPPPKLKSEPGSVSGKTKAKLDNASKRQREYDDEEYVGRKFKKNKQRAWD
ncbi:hypothetical protein K474DRAFT_1674219 [Panus rudis PR-1116 ss-1]|nr:hypothetical protein K474DRAFT_1674219 [Panus rudis PR-1116 ss-1]